MNVKKDIMQMFQELKNVKNVQLVIFLIEKVQYFVTNAQQEWLQIMLEPPVIIVLKVIIQELQVQENVVNAQGVLILMRKV